MSNRAKVLKAVGLAEQLIKLTDDLDNVSAHALALRLRNAIRPQMEMRDILALVPGDTLRARADAIGVSRQTMYNWLEGIGQPKAGVAARLSLVTGISEDIIRAR